VDEAKHRGDGVETKGGAQTGPVGTAGPLKARNAIAFGGVDVPHTLQQAGPVSASVPMTGVCQVEFSTRK
jgi:hypothetical protein